MWDLRNIHTREEIFEIVFEKTAISGDYPRRRAQLAAGVVSDENQFSLYDLLCANTDGVHTPDPFHLVGRFKGFGNALDPCHLINDPIQPLHGLFVHIGQVCPQLADEY